MMAGNQPVAQTHDQPDAHAQRATDYLVGLQPAAEAAEPQEQEAAA